MLSPCTREKTGGFDADETVRRGGRTWGMISRSTLIGALVVAELAIVGIAGRSLGLRQGAPSWGPQPAAAATAPVHERFETGALPHVRIELNNAPVEIAASPGNVVEVVETREGRWDDASPIVAQRTADGVVVTEEGARHGWHFGFSGTRSRMVHVTVPAGARVEVSDDNGRVQATGLRAPLRVRTSNGRITVADHRGDLHVESSNGRIELDRVAADTLTGETSNGRISGTGVQLRDGSLSTANGSIAVEASAGSDATVELNGRGAMRHDGQDARVIRLGEGRGRFTLESSNGSIRLTQKANA